MSCIHGEKGLICCRCENNYSGKEYLDSLKKIENDKLNAKIEGMFKDTERLDWVICNRVKFHFGWNEKLRCSGFRLVVNELEMPFYEEVREAIDAAMRESK